MRSDVPKQYLRLGERSVLELAVSRFVDLPGLAGVILVTSGPIPQAVSDALSAHGVPVHRVDGGATRAESVRNGLAMFRDRWTELSSSPAQSGQGEWVMVHDAARPCVRPEDVQQLLTLVRAPDGGLLTAPVRDTIKRVDRDGRVAETVDRSPLMHALTPQLFPAGVLLEALEGALAAGFEVTDESSAVERAGLRPRAVVGAADNLKITHPEDLTVARAILARQGVLDD
ncbi:2-C-methyl-D-erythritol 4-phosphate cytidylyltransferase [Guyparkeria hydrothermalis]|nr:2-C-methyl-D-erythritol 4-phosphate cytidylyltransferase [Guyparkeria hydrothermalis]